MNLKDMLLGSWLVMCATSTAIHTQSSEGPVPEMRWARPKITLTPLPEIQAAFDAIKDDRECAASFTVSPDGKHYCSLKRVDLKNVAVQIDGKTGPIYRLTRISDLTPRPDFSAAVYTARDNSGTNALVFQNADGGTKSYPAGNIKAGSGERPWVADVNVCAQSGRLVRMQFPKERPDGINVQVDDGGPVIGEFSCPNVRPVLAFDPSGTHYFLAGPVGSLMPRSKSPNALIFTPRCYLDGRPVAEDLMPAADGRGGVFRPSPPTAGGGYAIAIQASSSVVIWNGKSYKDFAPGDRVIDAPLLSPDGSRAAFVKTANSHRQTVVVDGIAQSDYETVRALQFTGDSKSLVYVATEHGKRFVVIDGKEGPLESMSVDKLVAGPVAGQYAYTVGSGPKGTLVRNGRGYVMPASPVGQITFTRDGEHLFSLGNRMVWVDGVSVVTDVPKDANPDYSEGTPVQLDATHFEVIRRFSARSAAGSRIFTMMTVELTPAPSLPER